MYKYIKRLLDIIISLCAVPVILIILLFVAPVIYFTDRGPVFYNAYRMGRNGQKFKMFKLRSMRVNAPDLRNSDGSTYNGDKDPRVTKIGRIIRKTSIDELPQIFNVLRGDMSFVGPRPNLANGNYDDFDDIRKKRLLVRPGITGYSQAYFRNSIEQNEKFINDCYYVDHMSFILDVRILIKTVVSVIMKKNIYVKEQTPQTTPQNTGVR